MIWSDHLKELKQERDEARAIARRLAADLHWLLRDLIEPDDYRENLHALAAFDALPWAKEPA